MEGGAGTFVLTVIFYLFAYRSVLEFLKEYIYPWLFKITAPFFAIAPGVHEKIYLSPWEGWFGGIWDTIMYFVSPFIVLTLVILLVSIYVELGHMVTDSLFTRKPFNAYVYWLMFFGFLAFHLYGISQAPSLPYVSTELYMASLKEYFIAALFIGFPLLFVSG